jgi:AP2 domain
MNPNRNITRIERLNSGGYLVRVTRRGKLYSEFFSDETYGKRGSLLAARKHRDSLEAKVQGYSPKQMANKERSNNTSGVPGVRLVEETDYRWASEPTYQYWVAQWSPKKGVRKTKRFSVEKYGFEEAKRLAIKARKKGVAEMES